MHYYSKQDYTIMSHIPLNSTILSHFPDAIIPVILHRFQSYTITSYKFGCPIEERYLYNLAMQNRIGAFGLALKRNRIDKSITAYIRVYPIAHDISSTLRAAYPQIVEGDDTSRVSVNIYTPRRLLLTVTKSQHGAKCTNCGLVVVMDTCLNSSCQNFHSLSPQTWELTVVPDSIVTPLELVQQDAFTHDTSSARGPCAQCHRCRVCIKIQPRKCKRHRVCPHI